MAFKLSKRAIQKLKKTVNTVDRTPASLEGQQVKGRGAPYIGFWAKITANAFASKKYSWEKIEALANDTFASKPDWGTGDRTKSEGYAVEVNGSEYVLKDSIVWLTPAYGQDYYVFSYSPGVRVAKTAGTPISAKSGSTYGYSTVSIYKNVNGVESDTNEDVKVFNTWEAEVPADTFVHITYSTIDACWIITGYDCDDA